MSCSLQLESNVSKMDSDRNASALFFDKTTQVKYLALSVCNFVKKLSSKIEDQEELIQGILGYAGVNFLRSQYPQNRQQWQMFWDLYTLTAQKCNSLRHLIDTHPLIKIVDNQNNQPSNLTSAVPLLTKLVLIFSLTEIHSLYGEETAIAMGFELKAGSAKILQISKVADKHLREKIRELNEMMDHLPEAPSPPIKRKVIFLKSLTQPVFSRFIPKSNTVPHTENTPLLNPNSRTCCCTIL